MSPIKVFEHGYRASTIFKSVFMKYFFIIVFSCIVCVSTAFGAANCQHSNSWQCQAHHSNSGQKSQVSSGIGSGGNTPNTSPSNQHLGSVQSPHPAITIKPVSGSGVTKPAAPKPTSTPSTPGKIPVWLQLASGQTPPGTPAKPQAPVPSQPINIPPGLAQAIGHAVILAHSQAPAHAPAKPAAPKPTPKPSSSGKIPQWLQLMSGGVPSSSSSHSMSPGLAQAIGHAVISTQGKVTVHPATPAPAKSQAIKLPPNFASIIARIPTPSQTQTSAKPAAPKPTSTPSTPGKIPVWLQLASGQTPPGTPAKPQAPVPSQPINIPPGLAQAIGHAVILAHSQAPAHAPAKPAAPKPTPKPSSSGKIPQWLQLMSGGVPSSSSSHSMSPGLAQAIGHAVISTQGKVTVHPATPAPAKSQAIKQSVKLPLNFAFIVNGIPIPVLTQKPAPTPASTPTPTPSGKIPAWLQILSGKTPPGIPAKTSSPSQGQIPTPAAVKTPPKPGAIQAPPQVIKYRIPTLGVKTPVKTAAAPHVLIHGKGKKADSGIFSSTVDMYGFTDARRIPYDEAVTVENSGFHLIVVGTREPCSVCK